MLTPPGPQFAEGDPGANSQLGWGTSPQMMIWHKILSQNPNVMPQPGLAGVNPMGYQPAPMIPQNQYAMPQPGLINAGHPATKPAPVNPVQLLLMRLLQHNPHARFAGGFTTGGLRP